MATQNPIEQEGTYPLPEAQIDRFMLKVTIDYPSREEEQLILRSNVRPSGLESISKIISVDDIKLAKKLTRSVYLDEKLERYIVDLVQATRKNSTNKPQEVAAYVTYGASPRASINIALAAKANAFLEQRGFVIPDDITAVANDVLRHRIGLNYEAEVEGITTDHIVNRILQYIEVP
jgi:MoxR-like ATPase